MLENSTLVVDAWVIALRTDLSLRLTPRLHGKDEDYKYS